MKLKATLLVAAAFLAPLPASAWSLHYLVTDRALAHPSMEFTASVLKPETLEEFLVPEKEKVAALFEEYYDWLASSGAKRFVRQKFDVAKPDTAAFLKAARLHPATRFHLVNRILPDGAPHGRELSQAEIASVLNEKVQFPVRFEDAKGQTVSARAVLRTFSDEPDWGMDRALWGIPEYGYGELPYGALTGVASQAPFHMQFLHENFLVKTFAPEMLDGMAMQRVELFGRLARLAFQTGHPYWGYRFSAWALHYLQDICQPYHAKAVPHGNWLYYLKFIVSTDKDKFKKESTQLVKNRHFAYEDFVAHGLSRSYTRPEPIYRELAGFLAQGEAELQGLPMGTPGAGALFLKAAEHAANHARAIDAAVVKAFGVRMTSNPEYDLESDPQYSIDAVIERLSPDLQKDILAETGADFTTAGTVTRSLVRLLAAARK